MKIPLRIFKNIGYNDSNSCYHYTNKSSVPISNSTDCIPLNYYNTIVETKSNKYNISNKNYCYKKTNYEITIKDYISNNKRGILYEKKNK